MDNKERVELMQWLIGRSDFMRSSYSNRAALVLSADAIILASIVFIFDKNLFQQTGVLRILIILFTLLSLVLMSASFYLALDATITIAKSSRDAADFKGPPRRYINPKETFETTKDFDSFKSTFLEVTAEGFIESACATLWVLYRLQQHRRESLKKSVLFILGAFLSLVLALIVALLRL